MSKTNNKKYKSKALEDLHEGLSALKKIGIIDKVTMDKFDEDCLMPCDDISASKIIEIRQSLNLSQPVFANYLNVSKNLVSAWERGERKPGGPASRLLKIIEHNGLEVFHVGE